MIRLGVSLAILAALPAQAQPSFAFHDRHLEQLPSGDTALVLRFLNPDLGALSCTDVAPGLDQLCETEGRVQWAALQPTPDELVLVMWTVHSTRHGRSRRHNISLPTGSMRRRLHMAKS